jgi:hypothetical protein
VGSHIVHLPTLSSNSVRQLAVAVIPALRVIGLWKLPGAMVRSDV